MVRHILKILQHLLQEFSSVSDHFRTLYIKGITNTLPQSVNEYTLTLLEVPYCTCQTISHTKTDLIYKSEKPRELELTIT